MVSKKYQPVELKFNVSYSEAETFDRIKTEMGLRNCVQALRRLMYLWDDVKWKGGK